MVVVVVVVVVFVCNIVYDYVINVLLYQYNVLLLSWEYMLTDDLCALIIGFEERFDGIREQFVGQAQCGQAAQIGWVGESTGRSNEYSFPRVFVELSSRRTTRRITIIVCCYI